MARCTPLHDLHAALGARMVDFGGWDMPVHYGSQIEEHHRVRNDAGVFDVSHMCVLDLRGAGVRPFLSRLISNDVAKLRLSGKALYSCMLNEVGGVLDDLIIYFMTEQWFRVVVNAGTRDKDIAWMRAQAAVWHSDIEIIERSDLAMLAVQGPKARQIASDLLPSHLRAAVLLLEPFFGCEYLSTQGSTWFIARTGYTGEEGFELILPVGEVVALWEALNAAGVASCGLGARDTLRLEAGMNLYGNDMDESHNPLESGLAWTVSFDDSGRDFVGRKALEAFRTTLVPRKLIGLILEDRGVLRAHQRVVAGLAKDALCEGEVTSGTFSPTLARSIAFARVPQATGETVQVEIRGNLLNARVVKLPFVRNGRILITL